MLKWAQGERTNTEDESHHLEGHLKELFLTLISKWTFSRDAYLQAKRIWLEPLKISIRIRSPADQGAPLESKKYCSASYVWDNPWVNQRTFNI